MRFYDRENEIAEVKRNPNKYNPKELEKKYAKIKKYLQGYEVDLIGLSLENM